MNKFTHLAIGDSLTQYGDNKYGWCSQLRDEKPNLNLINLGITGLNTTQYLNFMKTE